MLDVNDILVAKNGATVKIVTKFNSAVVRYSELQGDDALIQAGFEYPNVFRVIKPTDTTGEYAYYNGGGSYPWPGA